MFVRVHVVPGAGCSADVSELEDLFGGCGPLLRLVLPSSRALALAEFAEPQDARTAFRYYMHIGTVQHIHISTGKCLSQHFNCPPPSPTGVVNDTTSMMYMI